MIIDKGLEINKDDLLISKADKAKLLYAISIADSPINSKDSNKINGDLDRIWKICGYNYKKKFHNLFKQNKGMTISEYSKKINPNCVC